MACSKLTSHEFADPLCRELERDNSASFYFTDGELESGAGPGIEGIYESPYYSYHKWPRTMDPADSRSLNEAYEYLYSVIEEEGPFDGVLGFSQGATLAYSFLAQHAKKHPYEAPTAQFRCAVFVGALPPFRQDSSKRIIYDEGLQGVIRIPTLHVAGESDFVFAHSIKLHSLCSKTWTKLLLHPKSHEIPRDAKNVKAMASGIREMAHISMFG